MKREDIGLGIRALLSDAEKPEQPLEETANAVRSTVVFVPIDAIEANPDQPRRTFDLDALQELAQSIKTFGIIQPITIRKLSKDKYQVISGERRLRASKIAGLKELPAYIREVNDQELLEMGLVENIQREDLNALEVAISYQRLIDECDLTHDVLSDRVGKKRSTITNYIRLLKLPPEIQNGVRKEKITMGHARALAGVEHLHRQLNLYRQTIDGNWSVRKLEDNIRAKAPKKSTKKVVSEALPPELVQFKRNMSMLMGVKINITRSTSGKGHISIPFKNDSELNEIMDTLNELDD